MGLVFRWLGRGEGGLSALVVLLCGGQGSVCDIGVGLKCELLGVYAYDCVTCVCGGLVVGMRFQSLGREERGETGVPPTCVARCGLHLYLLPRFCGMLVCGGYIC